MTAAWWPLLLGLALGLRHAADADHLLAVATLLDRQPGLSAAARVAAWWGLGHTVTFLTIGVAVVGGGAWMPAGLEWAGDVAVGLMLVGMGAWQLRGAPGRGAGPPPHRAAVVGVVHGLAGSAGVALVAVTTMHTRAQALGYLLFFGVGTVLGMVGLTVLLGWWLRRTQRRSPELLPRAFAAAGVLSIGLGLAVLAEAARAA